MSEKKEVDVAYPADGLLMWRFLRLRADRLLPYGGSPDVGGRAVAIYHSSDRLSVLLPGLHAYFGFRCAANSGTGMTVCRLLLTGMIRQDHQGWFTSTEQTILWVVPATSLIRTFVVDLAERSLLAERASGREPDDRLWNALAIGRSWRLGEASTKAWLAAKAGAIAACAEAVAQTLKANDRGNLLSKLAMNASQIRVSEAEWVAAQIGYAEREATVARHAAALTVVNIDAPLPKALWRITRDAANAMAITREANRPSETRLIGAIDAVVATWSVERRLFTYYWDGLYDDLERFLTDTGAPTNPSRI